MNTPIVDLSHCDCIAYVRVSTEQQAGEKQTSPDDQRAAVTVLAQKLKRTIGHVFQDKGFSGATMDQRPDLKSLVASCEAFPRGRQAPGYVLVLNDSRWGRFPDPEESTYWRVYLSKRTGWIVRFAENDDSDSKTVRAIMRAVVSGQATQKRDDVKQNALRGAKGTTAQGYWVGMAPFGYRRKVVYPPGRERLLDNHARKAPDEKMMLVPDPDEAKIVRELFARYATGQHSVASMTEWALVAWPARRWTRAAIRYTLVNPAYVGDVVWGRTPKDANERQIHFTRPESMWYGKANAHEALVSRAMFTNVREILQRNRGRRRGVISDWVVSGIVSCRCGAKIGAGGGGRSNSTGHYVPVYRCSTRGNHPSARCPYPGTIVKHYLEDAVLSTLTSVIGTALYRRELTARFDAAMRAAKRSGRTVDVVDREIAAIRTRQDRLVASIESGTISSLDAKDRMTALRADVFRLTAERETIAARAQRPLLDAEERDRLVALAMDFRGLTARLKGPALRELIRPWIKRAEFNTDTRELMMEIRRVPVHAFGSNPVPATTQKHRLSSRSSAACGLGRAHDHHIEDATMTTTAKNRGGGAPCLVAPPRNTSRTEPRLAPRARTATGASRSPGRIGWAPTSNGARPVAASPACPTRAMHRRSVTSRPIARRGRVAWTAARARSTAPGTVAAEHQRERWPEVLQGVRPRSSEGRREGRTRNHY